MTKHVEEKLEKIPLVNSAVRFLKKISLPGYQGFSFYDLIELYVLGIFKGALTSRASAVAFNFFTAIFPFLLFILIVMPYIPIDNFREDFLIFLDSFLPPQTSEFFFKNIFENINNSQGGLLSSVFFLALFLMANGVNSLFSGFEFSYHTQITRPFIRQYLYAFWVALILATLLILTVVGLGYFQLYVINPLNSTLETQGVQQGALLAIMAKNLFFIIMVFLASATIFYYGTKEGKNTRFFSVGAIFTTFLIIVTSYFFGIYIEEFSRYNELYGSIGALLILLLFIWLNCNIVLLGFELNASLNRLKGLNK